MGLVMRGANSTLLRKIGSIFAAFWLIFSAQAAHAQLAQMTGSTQTVIVEPLSLVKVKDLDFGQVFVRANAGTVTISPFDVRTQTGGELFGTKEHHAAQYAGLGRRNQRVEITITPTSIWLTGPGARMRVRDFTIGAVYGSQVIAGGRRIMIRSATGGWIMGVGATLVVGANQTPGIYEGEYEITATYQ